MTVIWKIKAQSKANILLTRAEKDKLVAIAQKDIETISANRASLTERGKVASELLRQTLQTLQSSNSMSDETKRAIIQILP